METISKVEFEIPRLAKRLLIIPFIGSILFCVVFCIIIFGFEHTSGSLPLVLLFTGLLIAFVVHSVGCILVFVNRNSGIYWLIPGSVVGFLYFITNTVFILIKNSRSNPPAPPWSTMTLLILVLALGLFIMLWLNVKKYKIEQKISPVLAFWFLFSIVWGVSVVVLNMYAHFFML